MDVAKHCRLLKTKTFRLMSHMGVLALWRLKVDVRERERERERER